MFERLTHMRGPAVEVSILVLNDFVEPFFVCCHRMYKNMFPQWRSLPTDRVEFEGVDLDLSELIAQGSTVLPTERTNSTDAHAAAAAGQSII